MTIGGKNQREDVIKSAELTGYCACASSPKTPCEFSDGPLACVGNCHSGGINVVPGIWSVWREEVDAITLFSTPAVRIRVLWQGGALFQRPPSDRGILNGGPAHQWFMACIPVNRLNWIDFVSWFLSVVSQWISSAQGSIMPFLPVYSG